MCISLQGASKVRVNDVITVLIYNYLLFTLYQLVILSGWPKLIFQVFCLDAFGRAWVVGYGVCSLPSVPGAHTLQVPCWIPSATTLTDRIQQYFLGGSQQLMQSDIISLGADR